MTQTAILSTTDNIITDTHKDYFEAKIVDFFYKLSKAKFDILRQHRYFLSNDNVLSFKYKTWSIKINHVYAYLRGKTIKKNENYYSNKKYFFTSSALIIKFDHMALLNSYMYETDLVSAISFPNLFIKYNNNSNPMHHLIINEIIERYDLKTKDDLDSFMRKLDQVMLQNI